MSRNTNSNMPNNISKIIAIQFSILSPDEIRKGSVVEINSRDTYINNKPVIGGLFDPRMGVLEPGLICPTDGLDYMQTPGYFGSIELARPVFYIQYLSTILKILKCVCFKCSKILINKDKYKQALKLTGDARWKYVYPLCSAIKRCGEDTDDGCGCLQPNKIRKEGLATIFAEWKHDPSEPTEIEPIKLSPELVLKIFKRISDDDVNFMGFSPVWSRPDWMICQVMAVSPPAVRPSVKHDAQQRSEDDLSQILVNIIKTNKTLQEKIQNNASANVIEDWTSVLQYYVATQVDNKIPGVASVAQRSGRPLKSIKDRLNGKGGRMRGNLMAKRVDFSARSVITADPNISIRELGIPLKIAKNITKPEIVNNFNKSFLTKLVLNGPDIHPGAKILEKQNGESITLRYVDKQTINLEIGDIVHRHMMDGDAVLFNRQPTLHRMSMMCHIAKIMKQGDTFRMNVADTKPYNADFDGDEMNLHMPQDIESESELKNLAAVPYQIVSPANNSSIIGIYQDSMLGSYQFTRENINFTPRNAMNLLMMFNRVNENELLSKGNIISNFDILSQIMPPLSLRYKTKTFNDDKDNIHTSNSVIEIKNGKYVRGQMDKSVLGGASKGLLQRICNDYGNMASSNFIDDLQNIITEYMTTSSFSVGISDLISNEKTNELIIQTITSKKRDVKNLIEQTQFGIFENNTGKTNEEEFETRVNNILNQATSESGKTGLKSLNKNNRFVTMVNAGSKGSDLNISFMISCLGQQNVDGKRIPYGFENRTLPHFTKFDDSPGARGFVESSYINGLSPQELFFHAMGGRVGLIDTAVKTSTTGYIQRKLIKGLEDLMVNYDMTIRTNKNKIVQFNYGEDGIDTTKVENQYLPLVNMSINDIYGHYNIPEDSGKSKLLNQIFLKNTMKRYNNQINELNNMCKKYTDFMILKRSDIIEHVFKKKGDSVVNLPVAFSYIINNIQGQCNINSNSLVDITPYEAFQLIEEKYKILEQNYYIAPTELFKTLYYYYLSPKELLIVKRFNKSTLELLLETIIITYKRAIVTPGEMVGMIAGQSIGEVSTQMSCLSSEKVKIISKNKITGQIAMNSVQVGDFIDNLIEQLPNYTFNTGHNANSYETLLDNLEDEYYIVGVSKDEKTNWNKLSHVSKHLVNGELMEVTTRSGRTIVTTTSHSHLIRSNNEVVPIVGANMKEGMRIPVCKSINNSFEVNDIIIENKIYELDYLFGWFIGVYLADGSLNYNEIRIINRSEYYIQHIQLFIDRFGKKCNEYNTHIAEYGECNIISFNSRALSKLLLETCGNGSFEKRVPDFAFTSCLDFKSGLLQTYCDAEAFPDDSYYNCNKVPQYFISICSHSEQLIKDIALIFNYFNIFGNIIQSQNTHNYLDHNLIISCRYIKLYMENVGSDRDCIRDKLLYFIKKIDEDNIVLIDPVDKINGLREIITYCYNTLGIKDCVIPYNEIYKNNIERITIAKCFEIFKNHDKSCLIINELNIINQSLTSGVIWDEIINISYYTPDQSTFVYDFTVPGNQTFMTDSGVIIHNTLNTFHFAGVASKSNVTRGVPRIEEILSLSSEPKNPSLTVYLNPEDEMDQDKANSIMYMLEHTKLEAVVKSTEICFDPDDLNTRIDEDKELIYQFKEFEKMFEECSDIDISKDKTEKSKWILRMEIDPEIMLDKNITMDDINFTLNNCYKDEISCIYSDYNSDKLIFRIRMNSVISNDKKNAKNLQHSLDQSDQIYLLKNFQDKLLQNIILRGVKGINKVIVRKIKDNVVEKNGIYEKEDIWVLDTVGTNLLDILALNYIDNTRTFSNDIIEVTNVLGIEAARQTIYNELVEVIEFDGTYINYHNFSILCDRMTFTSKLISICRHGINNDNIGPIAKASFEETPEMFLKAARHAELDIMRGISANVMCGQEGFFGTSCFQVVLDIEEMQKLEEEVKYENINEDAEINNYFYNDNYKDDKCSINKLTIITNANNIKSKNLGDDNNYNPGF
jgi:DNA-directed RNA polymerase II subunit RPB1